jgi:hypothetical protein
MPRLTTAQVDLLSRLARGERPVAKELAVEAVDSLDFMGDNDRLDGLTGSERVEVARRWGLYRRRALHAIDPSLRRRRRARAR